MAPVFRTVLLLLSLVPQTNAAEAGPASRQQPRIYSPLAGGESSAFSSGQCMESLLSNTNRIPDSAFRATGELVTRGRRYAAESIRDESGDRAWCPHGMVGTKLVDYIQVDLGEISVIHKLVIYGHLVEGREAGFTPHFYIQYKREAAEPYWRTYRQLDPVKTAQLPGSVNAHVPKFVVLSPPLIAQWIRIFPYRQPAGIVCLRLEVYGCVFKDNLVEYQIPEGSQAFFPYSGITGSASQFFIPSRLAPPFQGLNTAAGGAPAFSDTCYDGIRVEPGSLLDGGLGCLVDQLIAPRSQSDASLTASSNFIFVGWHRSRWAGGFRQTKVTSNTTLLTKQGQSQSREHGDVVDMLFRFASLRKFQSFSLAMSNNYTNKIRLPNRLEVRFSIDGALYSSQPMIAHSLPLENRTQGILVVDVNLEQRVGRYIQVKAFFADDWLMISEVKFVSEPVANDLVNIYETTVASSTHKPPSLSVDRPLGTSTTSAQYTSVRRSTGSTNASAKLGNQSAEPNASQLDWLTVMLTLFSLSMFVLILSVTCLLYVKRRGCPSRRSSLATIKQHHHHHQQQQQVSELQKQLIAGFTNRGNGELWLNGGVSNASGLLHSVMVDNQWNNHMNGSHPTVSTNSPGAEAGSGDSTNPVEKTDSLSTSTPTVKTTACRIAGTGEFAGLSHTHDEVCVSRESGINSYPRHRVGSTRGSAGQKKSTLASLVYALFRSSKSSKVSTRQYPSIILQQEPFLSSPAHKTAIQSPSVPYYSTINNNSNNMGLLWATQQQNMMGTNQHQSLQTGVDSTNSTRPTATNVQTVNGLVQLDLTKANGHPLMLINGQPVIQMPSPAPLLGNTVIASVSSPLTGGVNAAPVGSEAIQSVVWPQLMVPPTDRPPVPGPRLPDLGLYTTVEGGPGGMTARESDGDSNGASTMSPEYASASHLQDYSPFMTTTHAMVELPNSITPSFGDYWPRGHQWPPGGYQIGYPISTSASINPLVLSNRIAAATISPLQQQQQSFACALPGNAPVSAYHRDQHNNATVWNNDHTIGGANTMVHANGLLLQLPSGEAGQLRRLAPVANDPVFWNYGSQLFALGHLNSSSVSATPGTLQLTGGGRQNPPDPRLTELSPVHWRGGNGAQNAKFTSLDSGNLRRPAPPSTPPPPTPPSSGASLEST